jgi:hypothetical protein
MTAQQEQPQPAEHPSAAWRRAYEGRLGSDRLLVRQLGGEPQPCPHSHLRDRDPLAAQFGLGAGALQYAAIGLAVHPLKPGTKRPATKHGFLDATTDPAKITSQEWWGGNRACNVGIATGAPGGGLFVLDLDIYADTEDPSVPGGRVSTNGAESLLDLLTEHGLVLPQPVPFERTPRYGFHMVMRSDGREVRTRSGVLPALDIRGDGGYICAWPSGIRTPLYDGGSWGHDKRPYRHEYRTYTWHGCPCQAPAAPSAFLDVLEQLPGGHSKGGGGRRGGGGGGGGGGNGRSDLAELPPTEVLLERGLDKPHDDNMTRLAGRLVAQGVPRAEAMTILRKVADLSAETYPWTDYHLECKLGSAADKGFGEDAELPAGAEKWVKMTEVAAQHGEAASVDWQHSAQLAADARKRLHHHIRGWLGERELSRADFAGAVCCTRNGSGEPLWGMMIDASSAAKTEVIRMAIGVRDTSLDEFTSAALLSFSKAKNPKPVGVLTRIPEKALITVADFSTILASSDRGLRDQLFADLRRVYDGELNRDLGNMARGLRWAGRVTMLAASTPAIDEFSSHYDKLGPRWLYHRGVPSTTAARRAGAGRRFSEQELEERRAKARDLFTEMVTHGQRCYPLIALPDWAEAELGDIAVAATICRSPVPRDGYGRREIIGLPVTEEPYRLGYQVKSLARGAMALGYGAAEAVALARRCAMDTVPPVRVRVLWALQDGELYTAAAIGKITSTDRKVVRRALEDLRALLITACPAEDRSEEDDVSGPIYERVDGEGSELVIKRWMLSASRDEDARERVDLVRDVMGKLYARPVRRSN